MKGKKLTDKLKKRKYTLTVAVRILQKENASSSFVAKYNKSSITR
jgi:hypothetical protein